MCVCEREREREKDLIFLFKTARKVSLNKVECTKKKLNETYEKSLSAFVRASVRVRA